MTGVLSLHSGPDSIGLCNVPPAPFAGRADVDFVRSAADSNADYHHSHSAVHLCRRNVGTAVHDER